MTRIGIGVALVGLWVFLWGDVSVANLASGAVVAGGLLLAFPGDRRVGATRYVVRPFAAARLIIVFAVQLLGSSVLIAREIVSRRSRIRTGIVACPLRSGSHRLTTALVNIVALTPGTMPVELQLDPPVLYVHVLLLDDVHRVRDDIARLEALIAAAYGPTRRATEAREAKR